MSGAGGISERQADLAADARADSRSLRLVAILTLVSLVVVASSRMSEAARLRTAETWQEIWLLEASSHLVILALAALFPLFLNRVAFAWTGLWRSAPALLAGYAAFSILHILAMHIARVALFPIVTGSAYTYRTFETSNLIYEARKDLFVFLLLVCAFALSRSVEQARLEQREQLATAKTQQRLTLRVGGATHLVPVGDIIWAKAAANYVEVHTASRTYFARMTLARLEEALIAASGRHVRIHRSHIVSRDHISAIEPTGEGDVTVTLSTGDRLPGSRRYRADFEPQN